MTAKKSLPTWAWIIILGCIFALSILAAFLIERPGSGKHIARVYLDEELICEIDLRTVSAAYDFTVDCEGGYNTISVRPGGICVSAADCSDGTCMKQGWLEGGITPIVCLPHGLVIQLENAPEDTGNEITIDAVAG